MTHTTAALRLSKPEMSHAEGIQMLAEGNIWRSPGSGWLGARAGRWRQQPDGVHLLDGGGGEVAICRGLNFTLCRAGQSGGAIYPAIGDAGTWSVVAVTDAMIAGGKV